MMVDSSDITIRVLIIIIGIILFTVIYIKLLPPTLEDELQLTDCLIASTNTTLTLSESCTVKAGNHYYVGERP